MENKHLNDEQIATVADALNIDNVNSLPADVKNHIAECNECANKALIVSELSYDYNTKTSITKGYRTKNRFLKFSIIVLAAASIIILFLVFYLQKPIKVDNNIAENTDSVKVIEQIDTSRTLQDQEYIVEEKIKTTLNSDLIAFAENDKFEKNFCRFANSATRSSIVTILSPQIIEVKNNTEIKIEWIMTDSPLFIEVFDNNGNKLLSEETSNSFMEINVVKNQGLYYWKVIDEDFNLIYCGKIIYKK